MFLLMSQLLDKRQWTRTRTRIPLLSHKRGHVFDEQLKKQQWEINRIIKKVRILKSLKHLIYFGSTFIKLTRSVNPLIDVHESLILIFRQTIKYWSETWIIINRYSFNQSAAVGVDQSHWLTLFLFVFLTALWSFSDQWFIYSSK